MVKGDTKDGVSSFLDGLTDGVCLSDADGKVLYVNPAARAMLKRTPALSADHRVCDLFCRRLVIQSGDTPETCPLRKKGMATGAAVLRGRLPFASASEATEEDPSAGLELRVRGLSLRGGAMKNCRLLLIEDVEREAESERQREDWRGMVAHDLRSPLTNVLGALRVLDELPSGQPLEEQDHGLIKAGVRAAQKIVTLLDDFLEVSRAESGTMSIKPVRVSVARVTEETALDFEAQAREAGVELRVQVPDSLTCEADPEKLARVLQNLLSNALKFTPKGGSVTLSGEALGDKMVLSVSDTGRGVDEADLPHIFDRYYRGAHPSGKKGLGLGLTFCREALEAMGGDISVEPGVRAGAVFKVRLPLAEEHPQEAVRSAADGFLATDSDGRILETNDEYCRMSGYTREELLSMHLYQLEGHAAGAGLSLRVRRLAERGAERIETQHRRKDGTLIPLDADLQCHPKQKGRLLIFLRDITQRKRVEAALRASRERVRAGREMLQAFLDNAPDLMYMLDADGRYVIANKALAALLSRRVADILGRKRDELMPSQTARAQDRRDQCTLKSGGPKQFEEEMPMPDGTVATHLSTRFILRDTSDALVGIGGVSTDITARIRAEQARREESVGTLAGGVAHDFNNSLMSIMGNLTMLRTELKSGCMGPELLAESLAACQRAHAVANRLLTFARGGVPRVTVSDMQSWLAEAAEFAAQGSRARCVFELGASPLPVKCDQNQISQVVHNLVSNAVQAMPQGGDIEVRARLVDLPARTNAPLKAGRYVQIRFEDHGVGIPPEDLPKLFDPYFSTKGTGRGLGLAISRSIVRKHGGLITAESRQGAGSVFTLHLPAADPKELPPPPAEPTLKMGSGRVLIMEDDHALGKMLMLMIGRLGYQAEAVRNGLSAIAAYERELKAGHAPDAVILDLTVPGGVGGQEIMRRLTALDPRVKAIVTSGYSDDPILADHAAHGFVAALRKPYRIEELSEALDKAVNAKKP